VADPTSVLLRVLDEPAELAGIHFTGLVWEHRPLGPALATLLTGRDVFVHRRACDEDTMDPRLPTLTTLLEMRGIEVCDVGSDVPPTGPPRLVLDLPPRGGSREGTALGDATVEIAVAPNGLWISEAPRRQAGLVRLIDVTATVLDAFGHIDLGWEHGLQGESVLDLTIDGGTCRECYVTDCLRRGWRNAEGEFWEPDLPAELSARMRGYVRRRLAETGLVDPLLRLRPELPTQ
jgi:hypothetical protein